MNFERVEREAEILSRLAVSGGISVSRLATDLSVSTVTIRNDLKSLEERGMLARTHGGARPITTEHILARQKLKVAQKERIAQAAAEMIVNYDRIMIEAGTSAAFIPKYLTGSKGVQIVTNSMLVFNNARSNPELNVILTGGLFCREAESLVGPIAERTVADFNARIAFLGTDGFSVDRGLTTTLVEGGQVAQLMVRNAEESWLLADSSKCGKAGFVSFLPIDGITGIITDDDIDAMELEALNEHLRVHVV